MGFYFKLYAVWCRFISLTVWYYVFSKWYAFFKASNRSLYIYPRFTDSLTHSSVRIMLIKTWQRWKNYTQMVKLLQGFRQQVTWRTGKHSLKTTAWNISFIEEHLANNNKKSKTIKLSTVNLVDERKKIHARYLVELG